MKLRDYFERIFIISLPEKEERRVRLKNHLIELGLAEEDDLVWVRAIRGDSLPPPSFFGAGGGAWGCLMSHIRIAQDAMMDGLANYLVLEDDVIFHDSAQAHLDRFMREVPSDWGQLYLGGQHLLDPEEVEGSPFVFRPRNINRTHAFALKKEIFGLFQQHVLHAPDYLSHESWHIDHQLGLAHERRDWNTYCPAWWMAGQYEGFSNIAGKEQPRHWWQFHGFFRKLPFVWVSPNTSSEDFESLKSYLHFGNYLKESSLEDVGLDACVGSPAALQRWLELIATESLRYWKLPGIFHPSITAEVVEQNWGAGVLRFPGADLEFLAGYPENGLFSHPLNSPVECMGEILKKTSAA